MNFQKITPIDQAQDYLDIVFKKAKVKKDTVAKIEVVRAQLEHRLSKIVNQFPSHNNLPHFYQHLMRLTIDLDQYKVSLGSVQWAVEQVNALARKYRRGTKSLPRPEQKQRLKQYYGRVSSLLEQINKHLQTLHEMRKTLKTYPDIKERFTVCLYGFPNVGKSTLLNTIAGTKAVTASYAFTTKTINAGTIDLDGHLIQMLDVPGTLARRDKMNNIELQADLVLHELAHLVVYVFDATEYCGYKLEEQERLFNKVKGKKPMVVFLSKKDLLEKQHLENFNHKHISLEEVKEHILAAAQKYQQEKEAAQKEEE